MGHVWSTYFSKTISYYARPGVVAQSPHGIEVGGPPRCGRSENADGVDGWEAT